MIIDGPGTWYCYYRYRIAFKGLKNLVSLIWPKPSPNGEKETCKPPAWDMRNDCWPSDGEKKMWLCHHLDESISAMTARLRSIAYICNTHNMGDEKKAVSIPWPRRIGDWRGGKRGCRESIDKGRRRGNGKGEDEAWSKSHRKRNMGIEERRVNKQEQN